MLMYALYLQGKKARMIQNMQKKCCLKEEKSYRNCNHIAIKNDVSPMQHLILLDISDVSNHTKF